MFVTSATEVGGKQIIRAGGDRVHGFDAATGELVWTKRPKGTHSASPVLADGRIFVLSEGGVTLVPQPGNQCEAIARSSLGEKCLASMTVSQEEFFIHGSAMWLVKMIC